MSHVVLQSLTSSRFSVRNSKMDNVTWSSIDVVVSSDRVIGKSILLDGSHPDVLWINTIKYKRIRLTQLVYLLFIVELAIFDATCLYFLLCDTRCWGSIWYFNIGIFKDYFLFETLAIKIDICATFHNFGS